MMHETNKALRIWKEIEEGTIEMGYGHLTPVEDATNCPLKVIFLVPTAAGGAMLLMARLHVKYTKVFCARVHPWDR